MFNLLLIYTFCIWLNKTTNNDSFKQIFKDLTNCYKIVNKEVGIKSLNYHFHYCSTNFMLT